MTPPPPWLAKDPEALAAYFRIEARLRARGEWKSQYALGAALPAMACAAYLRFAREVHTKCKNTPPADLRKIEKSLKRYHLTARRALVLFHYFDPERIPLSVVNAEGLDAEIASLCAPILPTC